ncbi:MAG TPA: hypothetical protein VGM86_11940 [Thermoanaerobaculia bacterium]
MKALQLHYTSCRRGQSGNAGFQTRALTPGIRPDEQREIERRGVYRPPRSAPLEPTAEEIARDFPRAFRAYRLESGRLALTRSVYTGRDYSGRWGNFFAHTLVLEDGAAPALWPIDLYEWSGWTDALDPARDTEESPPPLPVAELDAIRPAESFRIAELRELLGEQPGRAELLARMGRAVLLGVETSRSLVIRDSPTNVLYWIACLQKLFPPLQAWALSSSSYQDDPRGCADLNGTTGETGFTFDESERRYRFYMFDLETGEQSEVPGTDDDYPAVASRWLAGDPGRLERFFTFMRRFEARRPAPDLVSAIHLFELSEAPGTPGGERLAGMISFAARYATSRERGELLEILGETSETLARPEEAEMLVRFLADGARETGAPGHRDLAWRAWLALVRRHVVERGQGLAAAKATWSRLPGAGPETAARALQDPLWRQLEPAARSLSPEALAFLLHAAWTCLETLGKTPVWEQPEIAALIRCAASDPAGQALLNAVPRRPEALAAVSRRLAAAWTPEGAGRALGRVLAATDPAAARAVRRQLDQEGGFEILIGEWLEIPELERVPLAVSWLRERSAGHPLSDELAAECLRLTNLAVPLAPDERDGDGLARLVAESAAALAVPLRPDRPLLRRLLAAAQDARTPLAELRLDAVRAALPDLRPEEHETFLATFLRPALDRAGTRGEHQSVLLATFVASRAPVFERFYLAFLQARRKSPWPEELHSALRFWLGFDPGRAELRPLAAIEGAARKGLVLAISRLKPEKLDEVRQNLKKGRLDPLSSTRWQEIEEALAARGKGPWARLVGMFVRD